MVGIGFCCICDCRIFNDEHYLTLDTGKLICEQCATEEQEVLECMN